MGEMDNKDREKKIAALAARMGYDRARAEQSHAIERVQSRLLAQQVSNEVEDIQKEIEALRKQQWTPPSDEAQTGVRTSGGSQPSGASLSRGEAETARRLGLSPEAYARGKQAAVRKGFHSGGTPASISGD